MRLNEYQELAGKQNKMTFNEFCIRLKKDGAYIGEDWHIYRKDGRPLSRRATNGYYVVRKMYDSITYNFCEHRVIWLWVKGKFDETLTINHKDFDRENNNIENLELMTLKENVNYSLVNDRYDFPRGENSGKAIFKNDEVKAMRYLYESGWTIENIQKTFDIKWYNTARRLIKGARYGEVPKATDIMQVYPFIVDRTWRKDLSKDERIKNALFGISGEVGELMDMYKKELYHGHPKDEIHEMLELGDILYYIVALCNELGFTLHEIMYANIDKLESRYPQGFEIEKSLNRKKGDI